MALLPPRLMRARFSSLHLYYEGRGELRNAALDGRQSIEDGRTSLAPCRTSCCKCSPPHSTLEPYRDGSSLGRSPQNSDSGSHLPKQGS
eukprot:2679046-Prymnesium_polylepis.2